MFSLAALADVHFLAWTDPEFLEELRANPNEALSKFVSVEDPRKFVLVEDSPDQVSLVFPFYES